MAKKHVKRSQEMKKTTKIITLLTAFVLSASVAACGDIAAKTDERRENYIAEGLDYVSELDESDYTAEAWADIQVLWADYQDQIYALAAKSKMTAALRELKAAIANVSTLGSVIDAYFEQVDVRLNDVLTNNILPELTPEMGIKSIVYDASANHATFFINNQTKKIRNFADTGICQIFQEMFADVYEAHITVYAADNMSVLGEDDLTNAMLTDPTGLKHHVGEHFIRLYVSDYSQAPLSYLVAGGKATAEIVFKVELPNGKTKRENKTYYCEFVAL